VLLVLTRLVLTRLCALAPSLSCRVVYPWRPAMLCGPAQVMLRNNRTTASTGQGRTRPTQFHAAASVSDVSKDPSQWSLATIRAVDALTRADIQLVASAAGSLVYVSRR
jgi:hypothetical protein